MLWPQDICNVLGNHQHFLYISWNLNHTSFRRCQTKVSSAHGSLCSRTAAWWCRSSWTAAALLSSRYPSGSLMLKRLYYNKPMVKCPWSKIVSQKSIKRKKKYYRCLHGIIVLFRRAYYNSSGRKPPCTSVLPTLVPGEHRGRTAYRHDPGHLHSHRPRDAHLRHSHTPAKPLLPYWQRYWWELLVNTH